MRINVIPERATYWVCRFKGKVHRYIAGNLEAFCYDVGLNIFAVRQALSTSEVMYIDGWEIMRYTHEDTRKALEEDGFKLRPKIQKFRGEMPVATEFKSEHDLVLEKIMYELQTIQEEENVKAKSDRKAKRMGNKESTSVD